MLRPGPRSALPRDLFWAPLSPLDNGALAGLIARAESVDDPPYRTTAEETAEYFVDPTYSGVAGRDALGVMRAFALVRLRPAGEIYASMVGVVDPDFRKRGIGGALLHWQTERARHLIGIDADHRIHVATRAKRIETVHLQTGLLPLEDRSLTHVPAAKQMRPDGDRLAEHFKEFLQTEEQTVG